MPYHINLKTIIYLIRHKNKTNIFINFDKKNLPTFMMRGHICIIEYALMSFDKNMIINK